MAHQWRGVLAEYREHLPFKDGDTLLTLGEGGTPLVPAPALSEAVGSMTPAADELLTAG